MVKAVLGPWQSGGGLSTVAGRARGIEFRFWGTEFRIRAPVSR